MTRNLPAWKDILVVYSRHYPSIYKVKLRKIAKTTYNIRREIDTFRNKSLALLLHQLVLSR
jgi:hypothetical protein